MTSDAPNSALLDPDLLLDRYGERIYRLARRMSNSDADAEDVMQNTLIKILRKADSYRGESDPMGWIYRITLNEARELHRKRKRRPAVSLDALPIDFDETQHAVGVSDIAGRPDKSAMAGEIDDRIRDAIQELPDGYREAVVLYDLEGVPYAEAAQLMGLSLGGFKTRLHRARLHLRNVLERFWADRDAATATTDGEAKS
ncbi:MAG: RNA polymerase sigma factor [Planctomycetota bacterium]|nr:RNA polymerase sigma factor [Planctomycetota bacterium]